MPASDANGNVYGLYELLVKVRKDLLASGASSMHCIIFCMFQQNKK